MEEGREEVADAEKGGKERGGGGLRGGPDEGGGGGGERQEEEQKTEAKVSTSEDQSIRGLWRTSHGKPRMSLK